MTADEVKALLAPIPGDKPAGGPVPFALSEKLEEARKEINPADYRPEDPQRPTVPKKADWSSIIKLASEILTGTSKDLRTAARLTEALVHVHGFAGLRDGLAVLRGMVEQCWDRLYPPVEDGDLEVRAAPFFWLDDDVRAVSFPYTIRNVPLISKDGKAFGRFHWEQLADPKGTVKREDFDKTERECPLAECEAVSQHLAQSLEQLGGLTKSLNARLGPLGTGAPGLTSVRKAVEDCQVLMQQILKRKRPEVVPETHKPNEAPKAPGANAVSRVPATRQDAYEQLKQAANILQMLEPHSPIPYLIKRAVELGEKDFPDLIKELIREKNVLAELNREFGIKEPPPPKPK
jgi:type VI secretion system protein ImpA